MHTDISASLVSIGRWMGDLSGCVGQCLSRREQVGVNGSFRRTTKRPSCATVATLRYRLTSLAFVIVFDGRVPCRRCACVRRMSEHWFLDSEPH